MLAIALCCQVAPVRAQAGQDAERVLRTVADAVVTDAVFQFVDSASGRRYPTPGDAPPDARLRPASAFTDWRYWNGVLNLAMLRLADVLHEPRYADFARRNVAFGFDAYRIRASIAERANRLSPGALLNRRMAAKVGPTP